MHIPFLTYKQPDMCLAKVNARDNLEWNGVGNQSGGKKCWTAR